MLLSGIKKRWPVLTTVVAGLLWLMKQLRHSWTRWPAHRTPHDCAHSRPGLWFSTVWHAGQLSIGPSVTRHRRGQQLRCWFKLLRAIRRGPIRFGPIWQRFISLCNPRLFAGYPNMGNVDPLLPGTSQPGALPSTSLPSTAAGPGGQARAPLGLPLPGNLNIDALRPPSRHWAERNGTSC